IKRILETPNLFKNKSIPNLILILASMNSPFEYYRILRDAENVDKATAYLSELKTGCPRISKKGVYKDFLLETALMLSLSEEVCYEIINLERFKHSELPI